MIIFYQSRAYQLQKLITICWRWHDSDNKGYINHRKAHCTGLAYMSLISIFFMIKFNFFYIFVMTISGQSQVATRSLRTKN